MIRGFAREMRSYVDERSQTLHAQGERILRWLEDAYKGWSRAGKVTKPISTGAVLPFLSCKPVPYRGLDTLRELELGAPEAGTEAGIDLLGMGSGPIPYNVFKSQLAQEKEERR